MAIKTFTAHERHNKNEGGGGGGRAEEPRIKLKKLKSVVKIANLDRLRLSMRNQKLQSHPTPVADVDATNPSPMSGTSSPNYMRPTTSSTTRQGSSHRNLATLLSYSSPSASASSISNSSDARDSVRKSKFNTTNSRLGGMDVNRAQKSLKRVPSVKYSNRLSSVKSMKIRAKYSQFQGTCSNHEFPMEGMNSEDKPDANYACDEESIVGGDDNQKSIVEGSRTIKLTRLRSKRYPRRLPKSRFHGAEDKMPHYMKGTNSHESRKLKNLTRTSSWRPLKILAKVPSLRPRRSKVRKRPDQVISLSRRGLDRPTCSSTLKRSEFPDHIELHSGEPESHGTSSIHVCPYSYCSLNSHHHHEPPLPLKEFISAKRQLIKNQKEKQLNEDVEQTLRTLKNDQSGEILSAAQMMTPTIQEEDDGLDYLITIYAKPRKKWAFEGNPGSEFQAVTSFTYNKTSDMKYSWELPEPPRKISQHKEIQEMEGLQESDEIFTTANVEANNKIRQEMSTTTSNEAITPLNSSGGDLIKILSDKQKYTNIWHLIYQQFVSSDVRMTGAEGYNSANEKEGGEGNFCRNGIELDQEQSICNENLSNGEDTQGGATEIPEFDQTAALKLVQEGLSAILERDAEATDQQCEGGQGMTNSFSRDYTLAPKSSSQEDKPKKMKPTSYSVKMNVDPSEPEMPRQQMSESYTKLRKVFVTAKIIKAMERMKRISPRQPRYLPEKPTSEGERVYLRHLSRNERTNTEEWMLDHALRWAISRLGPDQQRRVAQLVEAFETVAPQQREGIRHSPTKGKRTTISNLVTLDNEEPERTMYIPVEQLIQHDNEGLLPYNSGPEDICLQEAHEDHSRAIDLSLESSETRVIDEGTVKEPMSIPRDFSQSLSGDSEVSHAGEMSLLLFNKQKYTCVWNLIYQQVASSDASLNEENGTTVTDKEAQEGEATKCNEINGPESNMSSYNTTPKQNEDDQNAAGEMRESDQSAAVKLVKEALDAILQRYELPREYQAISFHQRVSSYTNESLKDDTNLVEKQVNPVGEQNFLISENTTISHQHQVEPNELNNPPRKMSKSYNRLKKAFVTAKFINAIRRLRINSPRRTQSLPTKEGLNKEKVYLRHMSIHDRKNYEECMLDYALRQVISKMAPEQQRKVAQLVEAFETVTPQQKERDLEYHPLKIESATVANSEQMHQQSTFEEQDYEIFENQNDGVMISTKGTSHERGLQEDHDCKTSPKGHITLQKTVEALSESTTEMSKISSIPIPADIATEVSGIGVEETTKDANVSYCFPIEGYELKSEGDIASTLFDKQKYKSMWHLIHQQVVSSEASKVTKPEFSENDEDECQEMNYKESTQMRWNENIPKEKDSQSAVLNQSVAIKLVKKAIDAILQSQDQRLNQQPLQFKDMTCDDAERLCDISASVPTEENSQVGMNEAEKCRNLRPEEKPAQKKMPNSNSKLKKLIVTAKFIAAMERLKKINWNKSRHIPPEAAFENERVYLRHLSIDGRKNHEEWMLDYALRNVISSLAPDQQRKVALLVEAFETVTPEKKGNGFEYHAKDECFPAIESRPIEDESESVDSENRSNVDDKCPNMEDDRFISSQCEYPERNQQEDYQTNISSRRTVLSSEDPDSDQINWEVYHQANPKGCHVREAFTMKKEEDSIISRTLQLASLDENGQQDSEHNFGKSLFSDRQKTNSMWHLICQHLQSASDSEGGNELSERLSSIDYVKKDHTSFEKMTDRAGYDDKDSDASSVTSELTETDAIKIVKETIDDILEGPQETDNKLVSSLCTSDLDPDQIAGQKHEENLSRGYSKLRQLIICNKFIRTMQKKRIIHPHKQKIPAIYSGSEARKSPLKSNGTGEKRGTDEWMLDNVLQKVISGLAPAKQRRVALLVQAFEKVNPDQEERVTGLINPKKEPADDIPLEGNKKENGDTTSEYQHSSQSPASLDRELNISETAFRMRLPVDRLPQDIWEDSDESLRKEHTLNTKERKGETPSKVRDLSSVAIITSSDSSKDPTDVSFGEEQAPANKMKTTEKQLVGPCDQITKDSKKTVLPKDLKSTSDKGNNNSTWGLILQHVRTDIPEKVEKRSSTETRVDTEGNTENPPEGIYDKEAKIPTLSNLELNESDQARNAPKKAHMPNSLKDEGGHSARKSASLDKINNTSLWGLILQHVNTDIAGKVEAEIEENSSSEKIHDKELDTPTPTRLRSYESEAITLVQEAVNELLTLPEQGSDYQSMSTSSTSEQEIPHQVHADSRETSSPIGDQTGAFMEVMSYSKDEKAPAEESSPSTYDKLSRVIMCKRFIKTMSEMRKLKIQPQEISSATQTEAKGIPSLHQTANGEKKTWEEGMLDHALQQVVGKLAPAQKKRVALLVRAFETVGSQQEPSVGQRS